MKNKSINVIGAGFAGCECAWQIAKRGFQVNLFEAKPKSFSKAHKSENFAELVCSNSFKAKRLESAAGLLKAEMQQLDSLLINCAYQCTVEAGGALAVDRDKFSALVTKEIRDNKNITVVNEKVTKIDSDNSINVIATGPLTLSPLDDKIQQLCNGNLSFFDAIAPIVTFESIEKDNVFFASRYDKGQDDAYINCPLNKECYEKFYTELINAESVVQHEVDKDILKVYEGCMPIEIMAKRGIDTLRFGPLKPVGLIDPKTGHRPWANVQLRKENTYGSLYNMVGFQTNLLFGEQKRVFSLISGLRNAEFVRYGVMHRNTFIDSPRVLNKDFSLKTDNNIFFAGQITGVEGYMESASCGLIVGLNIVAGLLGKKQIPLDKRTMIGSLLSYVTDSNVTNFQPMGANFGIMEPLDVRIRDKKQRNGMLAKRSLEIINEVKESCSV